MFVYERRSSRCIFFWIPSPTARAIKVQWSLLQDVQTFPAPHKNGWTISMAISGVTRHVPSANSNLCINFPKRYAPAHPSPREFAK
jgi:hypothetical protein